MRLLQRETIIWLNSMNHLIFIMETHGVLFEVRHAYFCNIQHTLNPLFLTKHILGYRNAMYCGRPISVAARSKAWVYGRSLAGIVGSNPAWMSVLSVACCQVEVSATG